MTPHDLNDRKFPPLRPGDPCRSERRGCSALGIERSSVRYISRKLDQTPLMIPIRDLAAKRVRYGYFRICILLRKEEWMVNHKSVYR